MFTSCPEGMEISIPQAIPIRTSLADRQVEIELGANWERLMEHAPRFILERIKPLSHLRNPFACL
jgi:hypothetical protein